MLKAITCLVLSLLVLDLPAGAQERDPDRRGGAVLSGSDLPEDVIKAATDFHNDPRRRRFRGPAEVLVGDTIRSDVAALEGPLTVRGRIEGSVVMVNGDVRLHPGSAITGDLLLVGGELSGVGDGTIGGEILVYRDPLRYREEGDRIIPLPRESRGAARERSGWSDFLVTTGTSYNRVEGMPIAFGPRVQTAGSNPLRVDALAIYRTESGLTLDTDRMGYFVRAEQFLGGHRSWSIGGTAHSLVEPIEDWHLSDLESGLATFLFHRDFRDHYDRHGVSVFSTWAPRDRPFSFTGDVRWERHRSLSPGSPWTLVDNAEPWRPQPLVGEGDLGTARLQASYDTRSAAVDPASGWLMRGRVEQSFRNDLEIPASIPEPLPGVPGEMLGEAVGQFTHGLIDIRRYNRVDPRSRLNFRLLAGGSLTGAALPPQRQHALGGEGSLPGYPFLSLDCGAREFGVIRAGSAAGTVFFPHYGCDAFGLVQAEYRGKLAFRFRWAGAPWEDRGEERDERRGVGWDISPDLAFFVDAGRGWAVDPRRDEAMAVDVGVGLLVDRFGIYVAAPLRGGSGINAFVRLGPRF